MSVALNNLSSHAYTDRQAEERRGKMRIWEGEEKDGEKKRKGVKQNKRG